MSKFHRIIATACGLGLLPKAPGTFGSLGGLVLAAGVRFYFKDQLQLGPLAFTLVVLGVGLFVCLVGYFSICEVEKTWRHDDSRIVIDEVAGQFLSSVWFSVTWLHIGLSFAFFRFFDILKPWPISSVDKGWRTPLGTLLDDLMAGICAAVIMAVLVRFFG